MIDIVHNMNFPGLENEKLYNVEQKENGEIEITFPKLIEESISNLCEIIFNYYPQLFDSYYMNKKFKNDLRSVILIELIKVKIKGHENA